MHLHLASEKLADGVCQGESGVESVSKCVELGSEDRTGDSFAL